MRTSTGSTPEGDPEPPFPRKRDFALEGVREIAVEGSRTACAVAERRAVAPAPAPTRLARRAKRVAIVGSLQCRRRRFLILNETEPRRRAGRPRGD
jgi:hypothetical protein